jgi:PAS domain S-box-containing protein
VEANQKVEAPMSKRLEEDGASVKPQPAPAKTGNCSGLWLILPCVLLAMWAGSVLGRLAPHLKWEWLPFVAIGLATIIFALLLNRLLLPSSKLPAHPIGEELRKLLDSEGPAVVALDTNGCLIYCNAATERLSGYCIEELLNLWGTTEVLAPGEGERLLAEMQKFCRMEVTQPVSPTGRIGGLLACVRALPPNSAPSFDSALRRKDGEIIPIKLHISPLRNAADKLTGMVAVVLNRSSVPQEAKDRYQDLIENTSTMVATLNPEGAILFANPAWKRYFGLDSAAQTPPLHFEDHFSAISRDEAASLLRRALDGEKVERASLRQYTPDGQVLDLELSLSRRQENGKTVAIRCLVRDVTEQKQREERLRLQLTVSRLVAESTPVQPTEMHILEALCNSQGWDLAIEWIVDAGQKQLWFATAWGTPGQRTESLIQESIGQTLQGGVELAEQAWKESRTAWVADLATASESPRRVVAQREQMASGWAVPVRAGGQVVAVVEFYCRFRLRESREAMAAIEVATAALGELIQRAKQREWAEESSSILEILLQSLAEGICGLDEDGRVNFANPTAARLLGLPAIMLAGKPLDELLHGAAPAKQQCGEDCPLRRATAKSRGESGETHVYRADGSSFPAEFTLTPIRKDGRATGSALSFRDISQRAALDKLKDEFISTVSHEMRTPLTSIRGALGLLSAGLVGETNPKAQNLLRIAVANSDRLVRLINDILDLERIQSGREPLNFRTVQLASIVKQAVEDIQPMATAAGVQLIHDVTQVEVTAIPDRLLQVVTNLLSNAVKFSPPSSSVSVMLRPGITGVILSVIDHGRGIPSEKLETIFGRFQQVDPTDGRQKGGSGLGLAISRSIVQQHSGRIWAERNPVRGSTFRVFLPYQPALLAGVGSLMEANPGHGTVILADANEESRQQIAALLARHGYAVVQTATVEQTLAAALQDAAAILLDTALDGMNGWEILPLLRRQDTAPRTPIVLLSLAAPEDKAETPDGVEGRVAKPLLEDELVAEMARVLRGAGEKARVLVVEDDRELAQIIGEVFIRGGISVQCAHTLHDTIESCSSFQPHLMVLDIGLPDGDGFNVVDWVRQQENLAKLPLVVYSGRDLTSAERSQLMLGPTYFLDKARVQPQQLEALVLTMLRSSRRLGEAALTESDLPPKTDSRDGNETSETKN